MVIESGGVGETDNKGERNFLGECMFSFLIAVMVVKQMYAFVKAH